MASKKLARKPRHEIRPLDAYDRLGYECNLCGQRFTGNGHDCHASPGALLGRIERLERRLDEITKPRRD